MNKPSMKKLSHFRPRGVSMPSLTLAAIALSSWATHAEITGSGFHGIGCVGQINTVLWADTNGNNVQDANEPGLPGVELSITRVSAPELGTDTLTTDHSGSILFYNLCIDAYDISVSARTVPFGHQLSVVTDDDPDFDVWDGTSAFESVIVPLESGGQGESRNIGFGYANGSCGLNLETNCSIPTTPMPATPDYQCAKPVDELNMIWNGAENIRVVAHKGKINDPVIADIDNVVPGMEVAIHGFDGSPNDIIWEIYQAGTAIKLGESNFHVSCSDPNMNGPEDCLVPAGDGKNNDKCDGIDGACLNQWLFEGLVDKNGSINCTVNEPTVPLAGSVAQCERDGPGPVDYQYSLINNSDHAIDIIGVNDSVLGAMPGVPSASMQPGDSHTYSFNDMLEQSVSRELSIVTQEGEDSCSIVKTIEVTVNPLPDSCELMNVELEKKSHDELKIRLTNNSAQDMLLTSVEIEWPAEHEKLKEVKLSGSEISQDEALWSPFTIYSESDLKPDLNKRTIKLGDREEIEFKFDKHVHDSVQDYIVTVGFAGGCTINYNDVGMSN